VKVHNIWL